MSTLIYCGIKARGRCHVKGGRSITTPQALENIPMSIKMEPCLYFFSIAAGVPLGEDEHDFSNVSVSCFDSKTGQLIDDFRVSIFSTGKLGALRGGLRNIEDTRKVLEKTDIVALAQEDTAEKLAAKRTDLCFMFVYLSKSHLTWNP